MTHDDLPAGAGPDEAGSDEVRRLDRELAVANDITPGDDPRDDEPGIAPPPGPGRSGSVSSAPPREP